MVLGLPTRTWAWRSVIALGALVSSSALADGFDDARALYFEGKYFQSARYAFSTQIEQPARRAEAYGHIAVSLLKAGLPHAASYFFVRSLEGKNEGVTKKILPYTEELLKTVEADFLRKYLVEHTRPEWYDEKNRAAYFYAFGKKALLAGEFKNAEELLKNIPSSSPLWATSRQMLGAAQAIQGKNNEALASFADCARASSSDLRARCLAGRARVFYQAGLHDEAELQYERVPKESLVWPDILFEQAWNAFARAEFNRALGRLVTYKNPSLEFVHNPEIEVLRAQTYFNLCLYPDALAALEEFERRYRPLGAEVKRFVESNGGKLEAFFAAGKRVMKASLHGQSDLSRLLNRFVRSPYFFRYSQSIAEIDAEMESVKRFASSEVGYIQGRGFPGYLEKVLDLRKRIVTRLGGTFVKNSLIDYQEELVSSFEKASFIRLEILGRFKDKLLGKKIDLMDRSRGNRLPLRRDDQYYWSFNGEFWADELGDYIFGLESQCRG